MRVLVTGAEGFVGRHLRARLEAGRLDVVPTALDPSGDPGCEPLDVLDRPAVDEAIGRIRPDRVFHLAGFSSGAAARRRPGEALRTNAEGMLNVLESLASLGLGDSRVVVAGSSDAYGDPGPDPVDEDAPVAPVSAYGTSKAAQELVALGLAATHGLDVRVARLFPLLGPGQSDAFAVPGFCRQAAAIAAGEADPVLRVGNLDVERDFTDVRDGAAALAVLAELESPGRRTYNVCSGRATSLRTILSWILEEAGIDPEIEVDPDRLRPSDPPRIIGSARRLQGETGWMPERDVREGVRETYSWVRRSRAGR